MHSSVRGNRRRLGGGELPERLQRGFEVAVHDIEFSFRRKARDHVHLPADGNVRRASDDHEGDKIDEKALKALIREAVALNLAKQARKR